MASLIGAMAARAAKLAQPRAATYAAGNRLYTVEIRRPAGEPSYDRGTGKLTVPPGALVYSGTARITTLNPAGQTEEQGGPQYWADARVSIGGDVAIDPRINDVVTVTDDAVSQGGNVAGRVLRVIGVQRGGQISVGFTLAATSIEPSGQTR